MKKITPIIFIFVLLINLSFLMAIPYPQGFHGIVTIKDGQNPDGKILLGKINGVAIGSYIISDGKYDLVITDNVGDGGNIEFYIGDEKAKETSDFITFEVTELDLTFDTIPLDLGNCGNGICDENECSSCAIDCGIPNCIGNGRCDVEIGENCFTSPEDCACESGYYCSVTRVCKKEDTSSSNDDSSSGSPSGGGPSGDNPIITTSEKTNDSDNQEDILSISSLNEADKQRETGPGITGGVIGFLKTGTGIGLIFTFLIVVLGIGVMMALKKKSPKNE